MAKNVLGNDLTTCCTSPMTGFFRNGQCDTSSEDLGIHTICVVITENFLEFSYAVGNDLSTPIPEYQFSGLKPGDQWCLCLSRWIEAYNAGVAPQVKLEASHISILEHIDLEVLKHYQA